MKSFGLIAMTLAALVGCSQGTPGGPGTTDTSGHKPVLGQAEDTFNLSVPLLTTSVQQGKQIDATIGIKRATNFDEDVTLTFTDVSKGITIDPSSPMIKHSDTDTKVTIKATDEASRGDFKVKISGHPTKGGDAHVEFKLSVAAKDGFKLSVPTLSTSIKQGETQTVAVGISRDKTFEQEVTLNIGELPTGVTVDPTAPIFKQSDTETQIKIIASEDAALGNFDIKLTGHPSMGDDASSVLKLTVVKK